MEKQVRNCTESRREKIPETTRMHCQAVVLRAQLFSTHSTRQLLLLYTTEGLGLTLSKCKGLQPQQK